MIQADTGGDVNAVHVDVVGGGRAAVGDRSLYHTFIRGRGLMPISAFGPVSWAYARRFPPEVDAILCDGTDAAEALAEGVRRRRLGTPFCVMPLIEDPVCMNARQYAYKIYDQIKDVEQRRTGFEALAAGAVMVDGKSTRDLPYYAEPVLRTLNELVALGDVLLTRSGTEHLRVKRLLGRDKSILAICPIPDPNVPRIEIPAGADRVVVWAPSSDVRALTLYAYALERLKRPAIFVCNGSLSDSPHEFVTSDGAADALRQATVVVDTSTSDPGVAIALALLNVRVVAAQTTGVEEFVRGVELYHPESFTSIFGAVTKAQANRRATVTADADPRRSLLTALRASIPPIDPNGPLVSISIPTYNRPEILRRCLTAIARQTYPNLEAVVVNDAGAPVDHVVADFPFARLIELEQNGGATRAINAGFKAARGEFIGGIADDDMHYPDHIARLVAALQASHLDVAHTNVIVRLNTTAEDEFEHTYGFTLSHDGDLDPVEVLWAMRTCAQSYLIRRSAFESVGWFNEEHKLCADYDLSIRLAAKYDAAHVDSVTGEIGFRDDASNLSSRAGSALGDEIERMLATHAPLDRPIILERQRQTVIQVHRCSQDPVFFKPAIRLTKLLPAYPVDDLIQDAPRL